MCVLGHMAKGGTWMHHSGVYQPFYAHFEGDVVPYQVSTYRQLVTGWVGRSTRQYGLWSRKLGCAGKEVCSEPITFRAS